MIVYSDRLEHDSVHGVMYIGAVPEGYAGEDMSVQ